MYIFRNFSATIAIEFELHLFKKAKRQTNIKGIDMRRLIDPNIKAQKKMKHIKMKGMGDGHFEIFIILRRNFCPRMRKVS